MKHSAKMVILAFMNRSRALLLPLLLASNFALMSCNREAANRQAMLQAWKERGDKIKKGMSAKELEDLFNDQTNPLPGGSKHERFFSKNGCTFDVITGDLGQKIQILIDEKGVVIGGEFKPADDEHSASKNKGSKDVSTSP